MHYTCSAYKFDWNNIKDRALCYSNVFADYVFFLTGVEFFCPAEFICLSLKMMQNKILWMGILD